MYHKIETNDVWLNQDKWMKFQWINKGGREGNYEGKSCNIKLTLPQWEM